MTEVLIEAGTLTANLDERSVSGLLLPYGEVGNTNLGKFEIPKGTISLPRDHSVVMANVRHKREQPVGPATQLTDTDAGVTASFRIADTDEGDQLLLDIAEGKLTKLSAEIRNVVIRAGKAVSGHLFGAAFVEKGAFPSATLLAADVGDEVVVPQEVTDFLSTLTPEQLLALITPTPEVAPAAPDTTSASDAEEKEKAVPVATVPDTLTAAASTAKPRTTLRDVAMALASKHDTGDTALLAALHEPNSDDMLFAALNDIKSTYAGSVGVNIIQPQWIGELWAGRRYARKYIPLLNSAPLTSYKVNGFEWTTKPTMAEWAGDKANVPSNTPETAPYTATAKRYAGGHDIAREFRDWDVPEFWEAYFAAMTDSYAKLTDDAALAAIVAGATTVSAGTVPTDASKGVAALVDGALAVVEVGTPSFAIVGKAIYRDLLLTGKDHVAEFLSMSLGLEDGGLAGFRIIPSAAASLTGKVLVGAKSAATFRELPGSPIRTEALDQIKGGIDEALFGYALTHVENGDGLAIVTAAS